MVSIVREIQRTKNENKTFVRSKKDKKPKCKKKQKTGYTCKSGKAAIPSGIGRNCRMVALSRHIAGGRLRRFYIHPHIHGYPRAAKALMSNRNIIYCERTVYILHISICQRNLFLRRTKIKRTKKQK